MILLRQNRFNVGRPPKTYFTTALRIPLILQMRKLYTKKNVFSKAIIRYIHTHIRSYLSYQTKDASANV